MGEAEVGGAGTQAQEGRGAPASTRHLETHLEQTTHHSPQGRTKPADTLLGNACLPRLYEKCLLCGATSCVARCYGSCGKAIHRLPSCSGQEALGQWLGDRAVPA